ncbi:MAG: hypothetical protein AVDCRST_MAG11-638 [uncultured Gemmatimonadaceae bacterium]|uniref:Uncharacterized protein n=1 Tax=uncultured Gemmatimonadaceae bacterium TaxID=246130 RepID=A0A6J4K8G0_9BACT|nr:MAG: hypothetical protein AVDCRST_MAG11-638 [uncultured Gemmatimonadaceae bacterium]
MLHEHRRGVARREGRRAGEHLVADDAERVDVAPPVDLALAERLLRAHVGRGAQHHADLGEPLGARARERARRDAEVGDHGAAALAVEQDVVGLDVAVHHAARVRVGERVGDVGEDAADHGHRRARLPAEARAEALPLDERHDEVGQPVALVDRVDGHHVRVRERRGGLHLALEPRAHVGAEREVGREHLERHAASQAAVARLVDDGHRPPADLVLDVVVLAEGSGHPVAKTVGHRCAHAAPSSNKQHATGRDHRRLLVACCLNPADGVDEPLAMSAASSAPSTSRASAIARSATSVTWSRVALPVRRRTRS